DFAPVPTCQDAPPSLLYMIVECGTLSLSLYWAAKTRVPSFMVIPAPGPLKNNCHSSFFTCGVILIGFDQVRPSSSLLTKINCPVLFGDMPGWDAFQALSPGYPCNHRAATQMVLVL